MVSREGRYDISGMPPQRPPEALIDEVELFDLAIAGRKVQERQDEIGRQDLIERTLDSLPNASKADYGSFTIGGPKPAKVLEKAKMIQASVIWDGDWPKYVIGRKPTHNSKCTELLMACAIRGSKYWVKRTVVHTQDFEAWQDTAQMILRPGSYTQADLNQLMRPDGSLRITRYHRLSGHFREAVSFVPFRLMRADVNGKGIRQQDVKMSQIDRQDRPLSAVDMETFEVAKWLEQLSQSFGIMNVFQDAYKTYLSKQHYLKEIRR